MTMVCSQCGTDNPGTAIACEKCATPFPSISATIDGRWGSSQAAAAAQPHLLDFGPRYRIEGLLGEGGMGSVYKAYDLELNRPVALKLVRSTLADNPEALQRLKQELLLASRISHKNILRIHDWGEYGGARFVSMAYIDGEDLERLVHREGKLAIERALRIARQICAALEAAHAEQVVHRDLKPQNVLLDSTDQAYVSDFGLAKSLDADATGMTMSGAIIGTPRYMAPEQAEGKRADHRADIYAIGLILYEMITGDIPFRANTTVGLMYKHVHEPAKNPKLANPEVPDWLARLILKCLEKNPELRYQTAAELLQDIDSATAPKRSKLRTAVKVPGTQPSARPRLWKWTVAVIAMLTVAVAGYVVRARLGNPRALAPKPMTVLVADFTNTTSDAVFDGTLEPAFITALESASFITSYRRGNAHRIATQLRPGTMAMDEGVARLVAVREGINVVVSGSIASAGSGYRISVAAVDSNTGKRIVNNEMTVASRHDVLGTVGKLAASIRTALGDATPESAQLAAAETFTAGSLEAAHAYSVGQDLLEMGKVEEAIKNYQRAVELDPNLGRAYAGMAVASVNTKKDEDAARYYKKALSLLDRMSEREKYRTLGTYYSALMHNYPQAIQNYEKLVFLFPGDTAAYNNLSIAYVFTLDFPKAVAAIRHALELSPSNLKFHYNYAVYSMYAGDFATASNEARHILKEDPGFEYAYLPFGLSLLAQGDVNGAREVYANLEKTKPETFSIAKIGEADLEMYLGRHKTAIAELDAGIASDEHAKRTGELALKYIAKGEALLALGDKKGAAELAEKAVQLNSGEESVLYPAARVLIQAGEDAKALRLASALNNTLQTQSRSWSQLITGEIALAHKQLPQAVEAFQEAQKLHNSWMSHFLLGRAYLEAGHTGEALAEFETCKARQGETADLMFADTATLRYLPPLFYWLGRAQQGMGMKVAAKESFDKFLSIRSGSDHPDPLLEDAKRQAASIQ